MTKKVKDETPQTYANRVVLSSAERAVLDKAQAIIRDYFDRGPAITTPNESAEYLQTLLAASEHEVFAMLTLDTRNQVLGFHEMFTGTVDGASVYPREVVKQALADNAAAVIFTHNHPSGDPSPSQADIRITERLKNALALVDIRTLDPIIVGKTTVALSEQGLI